MQWKQLLPIYFCSYECIFPKMKDKNKNRIQNIFISPCQFSFITMLKSGFSYDVITYNTLSLEKKKGLLGDVNSSNCVQFHR